MFKPYLTLDERTDRRLASILCIDTIHKWKRANHMVSIWKERTMTTFTDPVAFCMYEKKGGIWPSDE